MTLIRLEFSLNLALHSVKLTWCQLESIFDTMSSENIKTRTRILQAAWKLLEAGKGKGVRMSDIAKQADISRQAVYLHFSNRSELLIATTLYIDEMNNSDARLSASRSAKTGIERLDAFIDAWGNYIPEIYPVAKALLAMKDTDDAAAKAWYHRMQALRQGCEAAVSALDRDRKLSENYTQKQATDVLWMLLSVRNWELLTIECAWTKQQYIDKTQQLAKQVFVISD